MFVPVKTLPNKQNKQKKPEPIYHPWKFPPTPEYPSLMPLPDPLSSLGFLSPFISVTGLLSIIGISLFVKYLLYII